MKDKNSATAKKKEEAAVYFSSPTRTSNLSSLAVIDREKERIKNGSNK